MKVARLKDGWRRLAEPTRYDLKLSNVSLRNIDGFENDFSIDFNQGLTVVCGENGVGKSTLLKLIYESLTGEVKCRHLQPDSEISLSIVKSGEKVDFSEIEIKELYYIDPSYECSKIINYIESTSNFDELLEGLDTNGFLNRSNSIRSVSSCLGKPYKKIDVFEVESALGDDITFPFFKVELQDGSVYDSLTMGMGEHLCMYLLWYVEWIEPKSLLLLEELENYLAAYSQSKILDHLIYRLSEKGVWTIITTHSEHILNRVGVQNTRVLYRKGSKTCSVKPENAERYLKALGLNIERRGVFFVEDYFASLTLKVIVKSIMPELLDSRDVILLRCDSNMEKVIKHFEPSPEPFFDAMAVFDADQGDKISSLIGKAISATCLPSSNQLSPEEEIWSTFKSQLGVVALYIGIEESRLAEEVGNYEYDDHHDRYHSIANALEIGMEVLITAILNIWLKNEDNKDLAVLFILSLQNRNRKVSKDELLNQIDRFSRENLAEKIRNDLSQHQQEKLTFSFNGKELLFA